MDTVMIAGASGVVGRSCVRQLLERNDVERVVALGRRLLPLQSDRLVSKVVDLGSVSAIGAEIPLGAAVALCCLGTTMKQAGSKEAFRAVDKDAALAFGRAALNRGVRRFVLISAIGADPESRNFYLKTKGETEQGLAAYGFPQLTILRPSFIDDQGTRSEWRVAERLALPIARVIFSVVGKNSRYAPITADALGRAMVRLAFDETPEKIRVVQGAELHAAGV